MLAVLWLVLALAVSPGCVFANSKHGDKLEFDLYKPKVFKSSLLTEYEEVSGLHPWYELAISLIHTVQPDPLPYEIAVKMKTNPKYDFKDQAISFELPAVIMVAIGIIYVILMPIIGICFCSCRCAKKCGGQMVQKKRHSDKYRRKSFTICLAIFTFFMFLGVVMALVCSANMGQTFVKVEVLVKGIVEEVLGFILTILSNLQSIIVNLFLFIHALVLNEMSDKTIREGFGQPLKDSLMPVVVPPLEELVKLSEDVTSIQKVLLGITSQKALVKSRYDSLKPSLDSVSRDMVNVKIACASLPDNVCTMMEPADILFTEDFSIFPSVSSQDLVLKEVLNLNFGPVAEDVKAVFENLPDTIVSKTKSARNDVVNAMDTGKRQLVQIMGDIYFTAHRGLRDLIDEYMPMADVYFDQYLHPYNKLRSLGMAVPAFLVVIIVALILAGMICGIHGYIADVSPTTRTTTSHRGGNLLMAASGFCFIFSWLLMLLTVALFMTGFHLQKVCEPLQAGDIYADVVDNRAMWEGKYFLGEALYKNGRIPLKLSSVLDQCRNGWASYSVFMVERVYNVSEKLNMTKIMGGIDDVLDGLKVDISDQNLVTGKLKTIFSRLFETGLESIPFYEFNKKIQSGPIRGSIVQMVMTLSDVSYRLRNSEKRYRDTGQTGQADKAKALAEDTDIIIDKILRLELQVSAFKNETLKLGEFVSSLQTNASTFKSRTEEVFEQLGKAEKYLQGEGLNDLIEIAKMFKDRILGYVDQFLQHVLMLFQNHLLRCEFVANIHDALLVLICQDIVYPLNGYWLSLGLSVVCIVPCIIFCVKLAKFYRRMDFEYAYEPTSQEDSSSYEMYPVNTPSGYLRKEFSKRGGMVRKQYPPLINHLLTAERQERTKGDEKPTKV